MHKIPIHTNNSLMVYIVYEDFQNIVRPNGAVVTRLTRNEKIIGSIPILGIM